MLLGGIFLIPFAAGRGANAARKSGTVSRLLRGDVRGDGARIHVPRAEGRVLSFRAGVAPIRIPACRGEHGAGRNISGALLAIPATSADASVPRRGRSGGSRVPVDHRLGPILYQQWSASRARELAAAGFLSSGGRSGDVIMYSDPASMALTSGQPRHRGSVRRVSDPGAGHPRVRCGLGVVTIRPGETTDPLGFWRGGLARDANGVRAHFLANEPAFEADGVRIFRVLAPTE